MVYKATQEVVRRVMPLLDLLAVRTIDKAHLLQYLSARSGVDWGALEVLNDASDVESEFEFDRPELLTVRDRATGERHRVRVPECLPIEVEPLVREEYKRMATGAPLSAMSKPLFRHFYGMAYCDQCRWREPRHAQIHRECHFAGRPINFERDKLGASVMPRRA